ncbi:MAG: PBECR4 domain-containing protein [Candidatus Pristimantibacillus sp.]
MIPNPAALAALTSKPRIDEINLQLLQDFYKTYLNPYRYSFELADGFTLDLDFEEEAFCHLVATESIMKGAIQERKLKNYRGALGWNGVSNGTITFDHLKEKGNKLNFKNNKAKFVYFHLIPKVLNAANKAVYYKVEVNRIKCELIIYDVQENAYIHLGLEKTDKGIYAPRTFLIETITSTNTGTKFIDPQPDNPIAIVRTTRTPRNPATTPAVLAVPATVLVSSVQPSSNPSSKPPAPAASQTSTPAPTQPSSNTSSTPTTGP